MSEAADPTKCRIRSDALNVGDVDVVHAEITYDRRSDTLLIHLFGRGRPSNSVPVGAHLYVMVSPDTETLRGYHIEGFLAQAVKAIPQSIDLLDYAELRGITPFDVRALRQGIGKGGRRIKSRPSEGGATTVQERRRQAILAFIAGERSHLSVQPVSAASEGSRWASHLDAQIEPERRLPALVSPPPRLSLH